MSLEDRIREIDDLTKEIVEVPEWGDLKIEVRTLTVGAREPLVDQSMSEEEQGGERVSRFDAALLTATCFDPDTGEPAFNPETAYDTLRGKSAAVVQRLSRIALRVNGMASGSEDELGKD
jgi:hypothetical protein